MYIYLRNVYVYTSVQPWIYQCTAMDTMYIPVYSHGYTSVQPWYMYIYLRNVYQCTAMDTMYMYIPVYSHGYNVYVYT